MPNPTTLRLLLDVDERTHFIALVKNIVGASNLRLLYVPSRNEGATSQDAAVPGRVWSHGTAVGGRVSGLGYGFALTLNGTTDYITCPDADDLSLGNGVVDSPYSIVALVNVTDTAAIRTMLSKWSAVGPEYLFFINSTDTLGLICNSPGTNISRISDAAITQGSWKMFGASDTAVSAGGSRANDMTLYQDGAVIASTPTNQIPYVAMTPSANVMEIGSDTGHSANFLSNSLGFVLLCNGALSTDKHAALYQAAKNYLGV